MPVYGRRRPRAMVALPNVRALPRWRRAPRDALRRLRAQGAVRGARRRVAHSKPTVAGYLAAGTKSAFRWLKGPVRPGAAGGWHDVARLSQLFVGEGVGAHAVELQRQRRAHHAVPMLSYNGEPITLQIINNGFNACRHQQYCIKAKCKSPSRSYQEAKVR